MIRNPLNKKEEHSKKIEVEIFNHIKHYLKKNAFFSVEEIIEYANQRLKTNPNVNKIKIESVLKSLIKSKQIIAGTKLIRDNLLENTIREEIYIYILNNAGCNINEIMRFQNIGSNQALWHLKFLEKFQFVRCAKLNGKKPFFKFDLDSKYDKFHFYLRNKQVKKIIEFMEKNNQAIKPTKISKQLKMNYNTIKKYLEILTSLNLIKITTEGDTNSYIFDNDYYLETQSKLNGSE